MHPFGVWKMPLSLDHMGSKNSARFNGQGEDGSIKKTRRRRGRERVLGRSFFFKGVLERSEMEKSEREREREFWGDLKSRKEL